MKWKIARQFLFEFNFGFFPTFYLSSSFRLLLFILYISLSNKQTNKQTIRENQTEKGEDEDEDEEDGKKKKRDE